MSVISSVVLTTPHADYSPDKAVERGLEDLGFWKAPDADWSDPDLLTPARPDSQVWLMLGRKLHFHEYDRFGIEGLRELVLALPWHRWPVPTHLQVLWADDFTTADDDFAGRRAPYAWNHETWLLP